MCQTVPAAGESRVTCQGRRASEGLHLTDVEDVVSTVISGPRSACEAGQSAANVGGDAVGRPFDAYVGLSLSRKVQRQLMFGLAEDGHRERPAIKKAARLAPAIQAADDRYPSSELS